MKKLNLFVCGLALVLFATSEAKSVKKNVISPTPSIHKALRQRYLNRVDMLLQLVDEKTLELIAMDDMDSEARRRAQLSLRKTLHDMRAVSPVPNSLVHIDKLLVSYSLEMDKFVDEHKQGDLIPSAHAASIGYERKARLIREKLSDALRLSEPAVTSKKYVAG